MIYNFNSKFIVEFIKILQLKDEFIIKLKADEMMNTWKNDIKAWTLNNQDMIKYNESLYVSEDFSIKEELLKCYNNNFLAKHFDANKINELLNCKYYWKSIIKNVKKYINTCNIYQKVKMKCHLS